MASLQQKRPSISNWFSSLRRQPKNKKSSSASLYGGGGNKHFQRSCIDLSSSTFYVPPEVTGNHIIGVDAPLANGGGAASTDDLLDSDRKRHMAKLCARCCCAITPVQSRPQTPPPPREEDIAIISPPFTTALAPYASAGNHFNAANCGHQRQPQPQTVPTDISSSVSCSSTVIESEVSRNVEIIHVPPPSREHSAPRSPTTPTVIKKRTEFKRVTRTKTTETLIISRPVELLLNERGEIVSRRPVSLEKTARSSSLGNMLDETRDEMIVDGSADSLGPIALDAVAHEFRFIDDNVTLLGESEHNSPQHNGTHEKTNSSGHGSDSSSPLSTKLDTTPRSMSVSVSMNGESGGNRRNRIKAGLNNRNYNNNNNNNLGDLLCDVCKKVIERNRHNKQIKDELCEVVSEMEALDVPEDCKHSNKDKQMSIGRKKFNMDPKKGIEYLVENRLLRHDPQDVAHFLYKGEGLNKTAIGDYLGEKNDFNEDVLKAFVALHDFTNLILVQALRQFLWSFRLPGEAQKIDRMMECFAQRYCQLNPDIFTNTDTCYVLSFAIIMLNTSLHNPSVKDKPTVEQFISMNRGINNGGDLPRGLLESLYESIRTEPFKIPQDDGNDLMHTFFNPDKEGWLWKQGGRYKSWKRRWFILNDNCLYYFEYTTDKEPRGIIPLENISVREIHDRSKPNCFELFATGGADIIKACKTDSEGKVVEGKHTVYRMSAATEEDQQEWIKRLTQSISHNPFYDILVQRKKKALSKS